MLYYVLKLHQNTTLSLSNRVLQFVAKKSVNYVESHDPTPDPGQ